MTAAEQEAIKEYIDAIVELRVVERETAIEGYVNQAVAKMATELRDHIKALAYELTERINGVPSPEVPTAEIERAVTVVVEKTVAEAVAKIPVPKDGENGKDGPPGQDGKAGSDGKDADPELIEKMVAEAVAKIPVPKDGLDGKDGAPGVDGKDGKDVDPLLIKEMVVQAVAGLPPAKDGRDGRDGIHGKDGRDGKDGITVEQLDAATLKAVAESVSTIRLEGRKFLLGDRLIATIPFPEHKDVYQPGKEYEKGDMVSFGGSTWHCQKTTTDKPETSDAWKLAVKKGRDFRPPDRK